MKTIELENKDVKTLIELLFRGGAYTDMYYRDWKKMKALDDKIRKQLSNQGVQFGINAQVYIRKKYLDKNE